VIIVVIDEPQGAYHGGDVAAPVFREIAEQILPDLSVTPMSRPRSAPQLIAEDRNPSPQEVQDEEQRAASLPTIAKNFSSSRDVVFTPATKRER
jgi:cell division protein FtsI (penicillin-binding protein 3)